MSFYARDFPADDSAARTSRLSGTGATTQAARRETSGCERKGGDPEYWQVVHEAPGLQDS
jgi:hypothetical protein